MEKKLSILKMQISNYKVQYGELVKRKNSLARSIVEEEASSYLQSLVENVSRVVTDMVVLKAKIKELEEVLLYLEGVTAHV